MEKRTQPRLEWRRRNEAWFAVLSQDLFLTFALWVWPNRIEVIDHRGNEVEEWLRETRGLTDNVDAMVFAEERAVAVCNAMFWKLLEADNG